MLGTVVSAIFAVLSLYTCIRMAMVLPLPGLPTIAMRGVVCALKIVAKVHFQLFFDSRPGDVKIDRYQDVSQVLAFFHPRV
jgi:hypothetical protein